MPDDVQRDAGAIRHSRTGRDDDTLRAQRVDLIEVDRIVAYGVNLLTEFAQVLDEIEGERVVVVDHQQHGPASSSLASS